MQGTYIRNLNINYTDPTQKVIYDEQLPRKFAEINTIINDDSQYKKKPLITIIHPSVPKPAPQVVVTQTNCFTKLFSCFNVELCQQCKQHLCVQCRQSKFLKFNMCDFCKKQLCPECRRIIQGKKVKLRNYRIKLKNIKQLHFKDCDCQDCQTERQLNH